MYLLVLLLAAFVSTIMWFINVGKRIHIHVLALILWGSVLMFTIDKLFSFHTGEEGGLFEFSGGAFILGFTLLGSAIMVWLLYIVAKIFLVKFSKHR